MDQVGNAEADAAADLGRRRLIDLRFLSIMLDLHRFMIADARVSVNHGGKGGTAPDPLVWDQVSQA